MAMFANESLPASCDCQHVSVANCSGINTFNFILFTCLLTGLL